MNRLALALLVLVTLVACRPSTPPSNGSPPASVATNSTTAPPTLAPHLAARKHSPVCSREPGPGEVKCHSRVVVREDGATPMAAGLPSGLAPHHFHTAYQLPTTVPIAQTVAIVVAYDAPTIRNDLDVYDLTYALPPFPTCCGGQRSGCFEKVNQRGAAAPLPRIDPGWALEASMDVETAHQICQSCRILLVEADSNSFSDLAQAVDTAVQLGATQVSNSYGGADTTLLPSYDHAGVAIVASTGDDGYGVSAPASFNTVVAVGGTTLFMNPNATWNSEAAWAGSGSGCSTLHTARSWQTSAPGWAATGCGTRRGLADVSADADPRTGAAVYDSTPLNGQSGWFVIGGTSLSAPIVAATFALRADGGSTPYPASLLYARRSLLHDIVLGSNGSCGSTACTAAGGYDGPTGLGTPNGHGAF